MFLRDASPQGRSYGCGKSRWLMAAKGADMAQLSASAGMCSGVSWFVAPVWEGSGGSETWPHTGSWSVLGCEGSLGASCGLPSQRGTLQQGEPNSLFSPSPSDLPGAVPLKAMADGPRHTTGVSCCGWGLKGGEGLDKGVWAAQPPERPAAASQVMLETIGVNQLPLKSVCNGVWVVGVCWVERLVWNVSEIFYFF